MDEWTETRPLYHTMLKASTTMNFICDFDLRVTELVDAHIKGNFGPLHTNNPSIDLKDLYFFFLRCRESLTDSSYSWPVCGYLSVCPTEWSKCSLISCMLWLPGSQPQISVPMCRLERPWRLCRDWIQGSAWWDGHGRPELDVEGERTLEYALAFDLLLGNTYFKKLDSHLIKYIRKHSHADRLHPFL